jgi:hypothetical protein
MMMILHQVRQGRTAAAQDLIRECPPSPQLYSADEQLLAFGWRIPYLLSLVGAVIGIWVWLKLKVRSSEAE